MFYNIVPPVFWYKRKWLLEDEFYIFLWIRNETQSIWSKLEDILSVPDEVRH